MSGTEVKEFLGTKKIIWPDKIRAIHFVINNWTDEEFEHLKKMAGVSYLLIGDEIAPKTGTPHLQGYCRFKNPISTKMANLKKKFGNRACLFPVKGTGDQNFKYCSKESIKYEYGIRPKGQGNRTDLNNLRDEIVSGKISAEDVALDSPNAYHNYGRTLHKIEDIILRKKFRTWMTTGTWYYGETGTGKSETAFKGFDPTTHYVWKNDNGWWDGYTGQETVIIDEFRGQIPFCELLRIMDKFPYDVRRRCREPAPFLTKHVIITSSMHPAEVYHNLDFDDKLEQLHRRCKVIKLENNLGTKETEQKLTGTEVDVPKTINEFKIKNI